MEIYIELALIENFLVDGMLLFLSLWSAKRKITLSRVVFAAALGAVFAVLFPLFPLPDALSALLRFCFGGVLVFAAMAEKGVGRYAITAILFYGYSFALAGVIFAVGASFRLTSAKDGYLVSRVPIGGLLAGSVLFVAGSVFLVKRLYKRRLLVRCVYPCTVCMEGKLVRANGFLDSGNRASVHGRPLCFLSPDLAYDLLGERVMTEEAEILTVAGLKKIKIFRADELKIYSGKEPNIIESVYFSPTPNIRARDYKIILNAAAVE